MTINNHNPNLTLNMGQIWGSESPDRCRRRLAAAVSFLPVTAAVYTQTDTPMQFVCNPSRTDG